MATTDADRNEILTAIRDLTTATTTPSTQQLADWLAGRYATRGEHTPFTGPPPWCGLEEALAGLTAAGLVETGGDEAPAPAAGPAGSADIESATSHWVALTEQGRAELAR